MNVSIDISNVVLKSFRLVIRPWRLSDVNDLFEYASIPEVGLMAGWPPHESKDESLEIVKKFIDGKSTFALECNEKVIGSVGIEKYNEKLLKDLKNIRCRELGFALSKDFWGQGLMPEALKEIIDYLFYDISLDAIVCGHFVQNKQSARVQEKLGFKFYSDFDNYVTRSGMVRNSIVTILRREDWITKHNR